ncbi:hypothetical protein IM660_09440 [Ruania alkalisoli]|uniref:DUF2993 domain-containing protein n=1 Tax=Ruania alkalisoli TaxID=2779775 RepID=A0A7M1SZI0_9MICO|nr:hypothetical protein [Ruania alkalisoli]QOR72417.1 hypothetical protein IM660_09440 [Ruania alkalisoli]
MFPLGSAAPPTTAPELDDRLADGINERLHPASGRVTVASAVDPDGRIGRLDLDLTGVELSRPGRQDLPPPDGEATRREVQALVIHAEPVIIEGVPVHAHASIRGLAITYQPRSDGRWWLAPTDEAGNGLRGKARVSASLDAIEPVLVSTLSERVAATGFSLVGAHLDATSLSPRAIRLEVEATIRRGPLRAVVVGTATAEVGTDMVLALRDLGVRSASPLVGIALAAVRGRLTQWEGHTVDLSALTFGGATVRDVGLTVTGRTVTLEAEIGQR